MIVFDLCCAQGSHVFEVWFASSAAYEDQRARKLLMCPICGDQDVTKAVMAPNVPAKGNSRLEQALPSSLMSVQSGKDIASEIKTMMSKIAALQAESIKSSEWVGKDFDQRARAIDAGEIESANIHGQATPEQAKALMDDGIKVMPLLIPIIPPDELN